MMKIKKVKSVQNSVEGYARVNEMSVYSCPGCSCGCGCAIVLGDSAAVSNSAISNGKYSSTA